MGHCCGVTIPGGAEKMRRCGTSGDGLAGMEVLGWQLGLMILEVFSNLYDSVILWFWVLAWAAKEEHNKEHQAPPAAGVFGEWGVGISTGIAGRGLLSSWALAPMGLRWWGALGAAPPSSSSLLRQHQGPGRAVGTLPAWAGTASHVP